MASQAIASEQYTYTKEEGLSLFLNAVKGNTECKEQRKAFNLCRSTPLGQYVEPEFCNDKAFDLINCFLKVQRINSKDCKDKFQTALQCASKNGSCENDVNAYVNCK